MTKLRPARRDHAPTAPLFPAALLAVLLVPLLPGLQAAQAQGESLPPPASEIMPPVGLTVELRDGKPVCGPAEPRLPADTNIALAIVSRADQPVTITLPGQFENGRGTLRLRTVAAGETPYACSGANSRGAPFEGKAVFTPPSG